MSKFGKRGVRCDWCGKFTASVNGEYTKPDGVSAGYINQPAWERFPGGRTDVPNIESSNDICEECAEIRCHRCGAALPDHCEPLIGD